MGYREIIRFGDPLLQKKSRQVEIFDEKLARLLDDMRETLRRSEGVGLAAVQVGVLRRAIVMDCGDGFIELINPELTFEQGEQRDKEGCLSLPGQSGITLRPAVVKVKAQDRYGKWHVYKGAGLKARCFCHELDHLDGILFTQRLAGRG